MAHDIAMNVASGDILIKNTDILLVDNAERIAQQILITLRFWFGEWFLDVTQGVPYLEHVLVKTPNLNHVRQIIIEQILSVAGVESVQSIELDFDRLNRRLYITYTVSTLFGLLTEQEVLGYGSK